MTPDTKKLRQELRGAGISDSAIDAAWPVWWSDDLESSPSSRTELRFTLARKLGLSPKPLLGERVEFVWRDRARFKHLSAGDDVRQDALTSFGVTVGRLLLQATEGNPPPVVDAARLREAVLSAAAFVDLQSLIAICWAIGVPIIHLRVFPLDRKSMHAMVIESGGRYAILLGRDAVYPAPIAFTLAHELGHIMLGHLQNTTAIVDLEDDEATAGGDPQEDQADAYAITLLTGTPNPEITTNTPSFSARSLAKAVLEAAGPNRIEPGTLALCLAHRTKDWPVAIGSLKHIYTESKPVWSEVNAIANKQMNWNALTDESADFLHNLMLGEDA
jgi:hypothetical protein